MAAANPGAGVTDIVKLCAEKWKALAPEDKKPYEEMAKKDKERHAREMAEYKARTA